jgi:hypothetical protein
MAQPDPQLSERTIASLTDGTPLVTRASAWAGERRSVPRHRECRLVEPAALGALRADARTSGRLHAPGHCPMPPTWRDHMGARAGLDGFGTLRDAGIRPGVPGETMVEAPLSADLPGSLRRRRAAHRAQCGDPRPSSRRQPGPRACRSRAWTWSRPTDLMAAFLAAARSRFLLIDALAALWLAGRLSGPIGRGAARRRGRRSGPVRRGTVIGAGRRRAAMA